MGTTWIEDGKERASFWAEAARLGFEHDEAHKALGVNSMKEYAGTKAEAVATLTAAKAKADAAAKEKADAEQAAAYTVTCQSLPESPALAWTKVQTPGGFVWSVTLRAGLPELLEAQAMRSIARQIELFEKGALAHDWTPVSDGRDMAMGLKSRAEAAPAPTNGGSKPAPAPQGDNGALTFKIDSIDVTTSNGKVSWKVKGGRFPKHGVTMWPEPVIAAGLDPDTLKIGDIAGWIATYILNDEGNPKKIVKLEAA